MNDLARKLLKVAPYPLVGFGVTKVSQAVRLAPEPWLLHISEGFDLALQRFGPSFHPTDLAVGFVAGAGLWLVFYIKSKNAKKCRTGQEHGSARWSA